MKKSRNKESDLFYNPISIKGAKKHNLKNIDVDIPRNKLVVLTGVSGSGKSSLAFNTLFNEGQKKYAESLNTYVRQFISKMESAEVDSITGLCPTIAIEQKQSSANARSTVGTLTEINDYLRLLFAKLGKIKSPVSGKIIQKYTSEKIISEIEKMHPHQWLYILQPIIAKKISDLEIKIEQLNSEGFKIYIVDDKENRILNPVNQISYNLKWKYFVILERFKTKSSYEDGELSGLFETLEFCFLGSSNDVWIDIDQKELKYYPNHLFQDGIQFEEPNINIFSFNNSYGFCKTCLARGWQYGVNYKFIIPNYNLSISTGALKIWNIKNKHVEQWKENFLNQANLINFPLDKAIKDFTEIEKEMLFKGSDKLIGIETFLSRIYKTSVLQYEEIISNFTGIIPCTDCAGSRLRKEALYVYVADKNMADVLKLSIDYFGQWIDGLTFSSYENKIADRIINEIQNRVKTLKKVGLHYLTLNRSSDTLSGGESQRIYLTKNLNSNLANSLYILDEPSIGLHPKDSENLIQVLQELRDLKNTVLVVEHDQFIIKSADYIIELGPQAAQHGGNIVAQGSPQEIITINNSLTAKLFKDEIHPKIVKKKELIHFFMLSEANSHNLKNISCQFPLEALTVVCGVSGSGKSTLIKIDLIESLEKVLKKNHNHIYDWSFKKKKVNSSISGNYSMIKDFVLVDQKSIGRSSRSSPITYIGGFDAIRYIFSSTPLAKQRKYYATYFSFNTDGGRCEDCLGEGVKTIEMQFLSDINVVCETCKGKKFKDEILEVEYKNKNIHDILTMTVDEAIDFFTNDKNVVDLITPLKEVGLGYLKLGQNSMTLSGGEAQRIKLATYLLPSKSKTIPYLFIFDEPTTGLHSLDITNLLTSFQKLIKQGHTIICIEHNTDVINAADWVIEIGPEGGQNGGNLIFEGTLANLKKFTNSITAKYL